MFEPVERRLAPDGKFYTYLEFLDYYGDAVGANDWADARPHDESVDDAPDPAAAGEVSADDTCDNSDPCGELYPDADAGGNDEGVSQATGPVDLLSDERRVALDGRMYYYQQFIDFFGEDDGPTQWADSPPPSPCAVCAGGPEAGTGDLASYCPQCHANICVACGAHLLPGSINGLEGYAECTACSSATDHSAAETEATSSAAEPPAKRLCLSDADANGGLLCIDELTVAGCMDSACQLCHFSSMGMGWRPWDTQLRLLEYAGNAATDWSMDKLRSYEIYQRLDIAKLTGCN